MALLTRVDCTLFLPRHLAASRHTKSSRKRHKKKGSYFPRIKPISLRPISYERNEAYWKSDKFLLSGTDGRKNEKASAYIFRFARKRAKTYLRAREKIGPGLSAACIVTDCTRDAGRGRGGRRGKGAIDRAPPGT